MILMYPVKYFYLVTASSILLLLIMKSYLNSSFLHHAEIRPAYEWMNGKVKFHLGGRERIRLWNYPPMEAYNEVKVSFFNNCASSIKINESEGHDISGKFFVITNFAYLNPTNYKQYNLQIQDGLEANDTMIHARNLEIINVLASNLKHPFIQEVHVLVKNSEAADFLVHLPLENSSKMVIQVMNGPIEMNTQLEYAGRCLSGKIVAISHQDNMFGRGWEKLKPDILKKKRLMYAITRHTSKRRFCKASKASANCDSKYPYIGSHDVFMFHVKEKFSAEKLKPMETVTPNLYGMENLLIWTFRQNLGYTVINPCRILIVYHEHCVGLRGKGRRRVTGVGRNGGATFTDKLE